MMVAKKRLPIPPAHIWIVYPNIEAIHESGSKEPSKKKKARPKTGLSLSYLHQHPTLRDGVERRDRIDEARATARSVP